MTDHLSPSILSALADGELSPDQLAVANQHLAGCFSCTSNALYQGLLKSATAKAGQRYTPPPQLRERLTALASQTTLVPAGPGFRTAPASPSPATWRFGSLGGATAAALLLVSVSLMLVQRTTRNAETASAEQAALVTEVFDQHIATLAASMPPQVISTDRHTVKPWFQGKIPFSFNLPESLPKDATLDGANLTYLHNQPVAQLLYSIGRHRVSVFVRNKPTTGRPSELLTEHSGFHVMDSRIDDLEVVAVSDVDPARLAELVKTIRKAQTGDRTQSK
jgi:anti-sigma factor RsiW